MTKNRRRCWRSYRHIIVLLLFLLWCFRDRLHVVAFLMVV